jgi:DNA (cytosine-5)-methyltransferase 1
MKFLELFAGAGGMSRGLEAGGLHCIGHAEIEPHARAVLRFRYPDVPLYGDVTQVTGEQAGACDLVSFGAPCQDLSVAGKRAGLAGARSSLFFEGVRLWNETGATYALYENVMGALSSNNGKDFAAVLSAFVGSTVNVPADGWGGGGGVVAGRTAVAAWRVLDLQHFGPPQRRVRVFVLAARTGGVDPAEVLALNEGVCRHPSPRQQSREIVAASTGGGVEGGCLTPWDSESKRVFTDAAVFPTLYAAQNSGQQQQSVMALNISNGVPSLDDTMGTLDTDGASTTAIGAQTRGVVMAFHHMAVLSFAENQRGETRLADVTQALAGGGGKPGQGYAAVLAFQNTGQGWWNEDDTAQTLRTPCGGDSTLANVVCTTGDITHALTHEGADASEDGTGRGTPIVVPTLSMGAHTAAPGSNGQDALQYAEVMTRAQGRPRRLTPKECERLMSWPDQWTATGRKDDGTEYALSDTARYRLCGNGVGSVCAEWIGRRLVEAVTAQEAA